MNCTYRGCGRCTDTDRATATHYYVNGKGENVFMCQFAADRFGAPSYLYDVPAKTPTVVKAQPTDDVHSAVCVDGCGWSMSDSPVSLYTFAVDHWVESGGHETQHGYRNMWGEYRVSGRLSGDPAKRRTL